METGGLRERQSLKSLLKQHYEERPLETVLKPDPARAASIGKAYVWFNTFSCLIAAHSVVPEVVDLSCQTWAWVAIIVIFLEMGLNWGLSSTVKDASAYKPKEGDKLKAQDQIVWKQCMSCQHDAPPRSHHCKLCNMCILKRDHHCFFTGTCIGFYNQRYFIVWLFWVVIGQWYAAILAIVYLWSRFQSWSDWIVLVTFYRYYEGVVDRTALMCTLLLYMYSLTGFFALCFFVWEVIVTVYGMTSYEAWKGIKRYQRGTIWQNFRKVFGRWWLLNFIFPTQYAPEGDPIYWFSDKEH